MAITFPTNTEETIDAIRGVIGRDVTFYLVDYTTCSSCSLDTLTNTSTDSFCPTCSGVYYIPVPSGVTISGHVTWGNTDQLMWAPGGQVFDGDCRIQIKYTLNNLDTVKNCEYVEADNIRLRVDKHILRGVKDLNRIIILLSEEERENGN